jgi:catechol 2,3-dioxygenase-like lactoylglutathione lyase family enzyme
MGALSIEGSFHHHDTMKSLIESNRRSWRLAELVYVIATVCVAPVEAQSPSGDSLLLGRNPAPFWAISVADLDSQLAWYRDTLGFAVFSQGTMPGPQIKFALLQQGSALIELLQIPDARSLREVAPNAPDQSRIRGFFKGGAVVADVEGLFQRLRARGVRFAFELGKPPGGPYRVFGVRDPEGNLLQFFGT